MWMLWVRAGSLGLALPEGSSVSWAPVGVSSHPSVCSGGFAPCRGLQLALQNCRTAGHSGSDWRARILGFTAVR